MLAEISAAVAAELLKVRRSIVPWVTLAGISLAGLVGGFFMFVLQDPERARGFGLLGTKAQLAGGATDWSGYFALTAQMATVGGLILFGVVVIWLFGREFSDGTAKDLMALPTSRAAIVTAKLTVALVWCLVLTLLLVIYALVIGSVLALDGWSTTTLLSGAGRILAGGLLTVALCSTYALVASVARGYLAAFGALFLTLFAAQVVSAVGYGAWFPWAVPSLLAGAGGPESAQPGIGGIATVLAVTVASVGATVLWWERADHPR